MEVRHVGIKRTSRSRTGLCAVGAGRTARRSECRALVAGGDGDCSRTGTRRSRQGQSCEIEATPKRGKVSSLNRRPWPDPRLFPWWRDLSCNPGDQHHHGDYDRGDADSNNAVPVEWPNHSFVNRRRTASVCGRFLGSTPPAGHQLCQELKSWVAQAL